MNVLRRFRADDFLDGNYQIYEQNYCVFLHSRQNKDLEWKYKINIEAPYAKRALS